MTYEALKDLLKQANELNNTDKYEEAEILANKVLVEIEQVSDSRGNQIESERETLHCSALITLSTSKWQRGDLQTALTLAFSSIDLADEHSIPEFKAKALGMCGNVYWNLFDYTNALTYYQNALAIYKEIDRKDGIATSLGNCGNVYHKLSDYTQALEYYQKALAIFDEIGNKAGIARNSCNIGMVFETLSDYTQALEYYQKSLAIFDEIGNKAGIAKNICNIGMVYETLSDYAQALTYFQKALAIDEELDRKDSIAANLIGIGIVYANLSNFDQALTYFQKALALNEELGRKNGIAGIYGNIGGVYNGLLDYSNALKYHQKALTLNEELGSKDSIASNLCNIGNVYRDIENYEKAREYLLKALYLSEEIGAEYPRLNCLLALGVLCCEQKNISHDRTEGEMFMKMAIADSSTLGVKSITRDASHICYRLYKEQERWQEALSMKELHETLKDEINLEEVKKQESIREQKKEIELTKAAADAKHQATQQLLHNVLPPSIAYKMLSGTTLIAEKLPSVSVLFADIVGFTKLSQRITPEELVEGLDRIFSTFDALAEKHGLEKIKTIGDAYMVVSGAPIPRSDHAEAMANFAVEMVEAMKEFSSISTGEEIQLRIGIHSGDVVAGVIGKKKFAYDMWGDAVNTASRMESHGEAGKIHYTEEFMRALSLSSPLSPTSPMSLHFTERGEMDIKGKGMMKTYFMEAKP